MRPIRVECAQGSFRASVEVGVHEDGRLRATVAYEDDRPLGVRVNDAFGAEAAGVLHLGVWDAGNIMALALLHSQVAQGLAEALMRLREASDEAHDEDGERPAGGVPPEDP